MYRREMFRKKAYLMPEPSSLEEDRIAETFLAPEPSEDSTDSFSLGGDREDLHLQPAEVQLIQAVAQANKNTIVSVIAGSAGHNGRMER